MPSMKAVADRITGAKPLPGFRLPGLLTGHFKIGQYQDFPLYDVAFLEFYLANDDEFLMMITKELA